MAATNVTFVEGLVSFGDQWLAYYGQSDTTTAVAVAPDRSRGRLPVQVQSR